MSKKSSKSNKKDSKEAKSTKLSKKEYESELEKLQGELVKLQYWVKETGQRIVIVFEGRDAAGKGGAIKRITERVSPRTFKIAALPAPSEREKSQIYMQRYFAHFPAAGEVVIWVSVPMMSMSVFCRTVQPSNTIASIGESP